MRVLVSFVAGIYPICAIPEKLGMRKPRFPAANFVSEPPLEVLAMVASKTNWTIYVK